MQKKAKEMGITEEMVQIEIAQYRKEKRNKRKKLLNI